MGHKRFRVPRFHRLIVFKHRRQRLPTILDFHPLIILDRIFGYLDYPVMIILNIFQPIIIAYLHSKLNLSFPILLAKCTYSQRKPFWPKGFPLENSSNPLEISEPIWFR